MKEKKLLIAFLVLALLLFASAAALVAYVDPFFHYHAPLTDKYYYPLDNQRSMNDGILRHFDYDAVITGTSMTQNFKTSELDAIFGTHSVKVTASGGSYNEIDGLVKTALANNPGLRLVVRGLDYSKLFDSSDALRSDLGVYPTYLYDNNIFNDYKYVLNSDILVSRVLKMTEAARKPGFTPGILSFDEYSSWSEMFVGKYGSEYVLADDAAVSPLGAVSEPVHLSEEDAAIVRDNIIANVVSTVEANPGVEFYYFLTPYSAVWWNERVADGTIYRQIEAKRLAIELMLPYENLHLFSFASRTDIITDLDNYKDITHYGEWINSAMLRWMHDDEYRVTRENYSQLLDAELEFFTSFDYTSLAS